MDTSGFYVLRIYYLYQKHSDEIAVTSYRAGLSN